VARADARIIGWGGLYDDPFDPGWGVEVGYYFDPAAWGHGFATELVAAAVSLADNVLRLPELRAFAHPENVGSRRVLEKTGFTCPLTENAVLRIVGHARYANSPGTPAAVAPLMTSLCALPGHVFWPDDTSLLDAGKFDPARLLNASQITDSYLLALACTRGGKLATFDRRLIADAVVNGAQGLHLIT